MQPILEIQNIGKKFRIQHQTGGYLSLRERMVNALKFEKNLTEDFWALKDVSFSVQPGESIGIIGRNGAGKSTLLKILSKITPPTKGRIISRGRIASLLEVGTGFHPELTGRENIFFNGSLLGMKRKEIESKFDEIVDFSGVEKFLDTPLKHFSSGMQLRLAFAVAAFLEPEILIIDEVLAVGDAEFQKKCLGKMGDVCRSGRTILFVSHNMAAVELLCSKSIFLKDSGIKRFDTTSIVIREYMERSFNVQYVEFDNPVVISLEIKSETDGIALILSYVNYKLAYPPFVGFIFKDEFGKPIFGSNPKLSSFQLPSPFPKQGRVKVNIISPRLRAGAYLVSVWFGDGINDTFEAIDALSIKIEEEIVTKHSASIIGSVVPEVTWEFN